MLFSKAERNFEVKDEDFEVVNLCKEGRIENFEILVKKYQRSLINFIFRTVQDFEDACEIAQETFLIAYKKIKTFKGEAKFSTWLYKIALNLSRNKLKRYKKNLENLKDNLKIASPDPLPLEEMEREEIKNKVLKSLNLLKIEFKEIILLRDMEGFSYEEIGYLLKIPEGTVKSRLSRAREEFIKIFESLRSK